MFSVYRKRPLWPDRPGVAPRGRTPLFAGLVAIGLATLSIAAQADPTQSDLEAMKALYQRPPAMPYPKNNPYSAAKAELGRQLFFDPHLSGPSNTSCATCHNPERSWGDGLPTGVGSAGNRLARHSPTILNLAWAEVLFWDGRADTLEEQAVQPILNPDEMNMPMPRLLDSLRDTPGYRTAFNNAFPGEPISASTVGKAIATFERTVISGQAPFDQWISGDENAIDASAKRGFVVFNTKGHCSTCHSGWRLTDDSFQDIGLGDDDLGRGKVVEGLEPLRHAFKTPSLRNIAERAPYMHNGSLSTLTDVIRHYRNGFMRRPSLSVEIRRLLLTDMDAKDLAAFLKTLTSTDAKISVPTPVIEEAKR